MTKLPWKFEEAMACFFQSFLHYSPLILWPLFGYMARDIARAKGCQGINQYLIIGPFGYLTALAMPDFKSQMYLKSIAIADRHST